MTEPRDPRDQISSDLQDIADSIPVIPRPLAALRSLIALLPNPLAATTQGSFPAEDLTQPAGAAETLSGGGPGTTSGTELQDGSITDKNIAADAITARTIKAGSILVSQFAQPGANEAPNSGFEILGGATPLVYGYGGTFPPGFDTVRSTPSANQLLTTIARTGAYSLRLDTPAGPIVCQAELGPVPVTQGKRYRVRVWVRGIGGNNVGATAAILIRYLDAAKTSLGFITLDSGNIVRRVLVRANTTPVVLEDFALIPATAVYVNVVLENDASGAVGDGILFDDVEFFSADDDVNAAGGNVLIDSTGITIRNGKLVFNDAYGSTAMDGNGFGRTWQRFIQSGLYNSDLYAATTTPASIINNSTNPLPFWSWVQSSGTHMSAKWVADATVGSGGRIDFDMTASGAAADAQYIEQIIPILASKGTGVAYDLGCVYKNGTKSDLISLGWQFLKADKSTLTGSGVTLSSNGLTDGSLGIISSKTGRVPADAAYVRIRIIHERAGAATTDADTMTFYSVWIKAQTPVISIPDGADATKDPVVLQNNNGALLIIHPDTGQISMAANGRFSFLGPAAAPGILQSSQPLAAANIGATVALTCTTAGTWYKHAGLGTNGLAITPDFVGQKWLVTFSGSYETDKVVNSLLAVRLDSDTAGTLRSWEAIQQHDIPTANRQHNFGGSFIFYASTVATHYIYFYFQTSVNTTVVAVYGGAAYASQIRAYPLP